MRLSKTHPFIYFVPSAILALGILVSCGTENKFSSATIASTAAPADLINNQPAPPPIPENQSPTIGPIIDQNPTIPTPTPVPVPPICNPFGGSGDTKIKATLYEGNSSIKKFQDFLTINKKFAIPLYLPDLNVPKTKWSEGFVGTDGIPLMNSKGEKFIEWFALELQSSITLNDIQDEGYYTFASFADDGFFLDIKVGNQFIRAIDYDLISPPTFHCFTSNSSNANQIKAFRLTRQTKLNMKGGYFQGPRDYIAMQLYMKKVANLSDYSAEVIEKNILRQECAATNRYELLDSENYFLAIPPDC